MGNVRISGPYGVSALDPVSRMTIGPAAETGIPLAVTLSVCALAPPAGTASPHSPGARGSLRLGCYRTSASGGKGRHQSTSRWRGHTHSCAKQVLGGVHLPYWPDGKEVCERPARPAGTVPFLGPAANVVVIRACGSRLPINDRQPLVPMINRPYVRCHVRTSFRAAVAHSACGVFWRRHWLTRHRD